MTFFSLYDSCILHFAFSFSFMGRSARSAPLMHFALLRIIDCRCRPIISTNKHNRQSVDTLIR